jgi:hypothetical protein
LKETRHAYLTAPSSTFPRWPTVKILATVREYCRMNVTTSGLEYLNKTLDSRCQVVLIFPAATAASHCLFRLSWPSRAVSSSPLGNNAEVSDGSAVNKGATASASWSGLGLLELNNFR